MDTSETYIKMCEKAEEIQTLKVPLFQEHGNFFADNITPSPTWLISCDICFDLTKEPDRFIWLPRQDQLQEMSKYGAGFPSGIHEIDIFCHSYYRGDKSGEYADDWEDAELVFETWEQLWLAFVMKEKYNKTWNGEDWVPIR